MRTVQAYLDAVEGQWDVFTGIIATLHPDHVDDQTNTIDKYLERQASLRVVVALPFLVGHREEVHSTLWGFQNTQYRDLIAESEQVLQVMAKLNLHVLPNFEASLIESSVQARDSAAVGRT